jgi:hypothetical protein
MESDNVLIIHREGSSYYLHAQVFGIDEANNKPTTSVSIPIYEIQVRPATSLPCNGVASTSGEGGDDTGHKDIVSVYVREKVPVLKTGDIIPKTWAVVDKNYYNSFMCEDIKLTGNGTNSSVSNSISYAVDGDLSTYWLDNGNNVNQWLELEFPNAIKITKMKTYIGRTLNNFTDVKIQGSNDNSIWTDLYVLTTFQTALTEITLSNTDYYKYYRIYYTFPSSSVGKATVYELQTSEYEVLE